MQRKNDVPAPVRRAALYIRVSTDEQARKGYSLPAQQEALEKYAKANGYIVAGLYVDDGVSAHQIYTRRPGLMRLLEDVEADRIDTILVIKLDRWFRSVKEYYKVQEILDQHHVAWKTILEDYETESTHGVMITHIMLSVAQAESDRTSDRIKFVFENKVERGEVITGKTPLGMKIENKHLVPDPETVEAARDLFRHYLQTGSIGETMRYMRETHHVSMHTSTVKHALSNRLYRGEYRENTSYCEPLISPEVFDAVQERLKCRSIRRNKTGRIFLFSGILICKECGHRMTSQYNGTRGNSLYYYRCAQSLLYHECVHNKLLNEAIFEKWLLDNLSVELDKWECEWKLAATKTPKPALDCNAILKKLDRLKDLYVDGLITKEQYRADYDKLSSALAKAQENDRLPTPDFDEFRKVLSSNFCVAYEKLDRYSRRDFWQGIIEKAEIDVHNQPVLFFRPSFTIHL